MIAYFDCFSGISGDMVLGALVDAGVSPKRLETELSGLPVNGFRLKVRKVKRAGLSASKVDVVLEQGKRRKGKAVEGRKFKDIKRIIKKSSLPREIRQKGLSIFQRLFDAEAKVHGERVDRIHLHELGAVDCIVDIFGTLIGLSMLGIRSVFSSPLNLGGGIVKTEHGILPVPAPSTSELLIGVPVYSSDVPLELTTPTGAALISSLTTEFGVMPYMHVSKIGNGAGGYQLKDRPNVLRLFAGHKPGESQARNNEQDDKDITVVETNIDDMNPQAYDYVVEKLLKAGALDVFLTQIIMKKGRPGVQLKMLCGRDKRDDLIKILFRETTTIGLRFYDTHRKVLNRSVHVVDTKLGRVRVKISRLDGDVVQLTPEYLDCRKIAEKHNIPLLEVIKSVASLELAGNVVKKK
jgi:uncharacterized protein (TIGR00299 family) protein